MLPGSPKFGAGGCAVRVWYCPALRQGMGLGRRGVLLQLHKIFMAQCMYPVAHPSVSRLVHTLYIRT